MFSSSNVVLSLYFCLLSIITTGEMNRKRWIDQDDTIFLKIQFPMVLNTEKHKTKYCLYALKNNLTFVKQVLLSCYETFCKKKKMFIFQTEASH